jgi:hypothetical protein
VPQSIRLHALFAFTLVAACSPPVDTRDTGASDASDSFDASDAMVPDDVPAPDAADARASLEYMPTGCSYRVHTTPGTSLNAMGDTNTFGSNPDPQDAHVTWASDPSTSAVVLWRTDAATLATVVQYGTDMATLGSMATGHVTSSSASATLGAHMHEVHLCGLVPDTTYYYRAGGEGHWSAVQRFRTAPAAGGSGYDVNFAVAGDTRDDFAVWTMVQSQILAMSGASTPDFLMFSGDALPIGTDQNLWNQWFAASRPTMPLMPYVFAHGNHEALSLNYLVQIAQPQSDDPQADELYFAFDYGPVHFVVLNDSASSATALASLISAEQSWLMRDLAAVDRARTPWVVAFHHKGAFSSSNHTSDTDVTSVRAAWPPVFAQSGVDVVLNGHDHNFEVTQPLLGDGTPAPSGMHGTVYYTAAGAGAMLYPSATRGWTRYSESVVNYLLVHVTEHAFQVTPYRLDGTVIDQGTLSLTR